MEMQLFILGHIILLAICISASLIASSNGDGDEEVGGLMIAGFFILFIPLEIIYWVLHWFFVS